VTRRLLFSYLGLALLVLAVLEIPLGIVNGRNERSDLTTKVERDASFLASFAEDALEEGNRPRALAVAALDYSKRNGSRVVVVNRRGVSVIDTNPPAGGPRTFATRPEIAAALRGNIASGTRYSETLHENLLYVAVPASSGAKVTGAVRITYPTSEVDSRVRRYWLMLLVIGVMVLAATALVGLRFARWVSSPLSRLEATAAEAGGGDLSTRAGEETGPPEVRSLAAAFNHMIAELEQLVRSQEEFVADASHQLRTPLTALRLRLEILGDEVSDSGRADLERALEEVERLSRLVDGLLALARTEVSPHEQVNLAELVNERVEAWSALTAERGVRLETSIEGTALAGRDRLAQALENLLANALAVSSEGGSITISGSSGELHVIDLGPGMSAEERERAFDRFWRGGKPGAGSGLGLAIVKRLVETDGGTVELREAPGGGLDAVIRLQRG
jgi:signal transduction histidine kinase